MSPAQKIFVFKHNQFKKQTLHVLHGYVPVVFHGNSHFRPWIHEFLLGILPASELPIQERHGSLSELASIWSSICSKVAGV